MGKKRIIQKTEQELLDEKEKMEKKLRKEIEVGQQVKAGHSLRTGRIYIATSYNNTIITLTDETGNVLYSSSAGRVGFKGTKKGTSFAASKVAQAIISSCEKFKIRKVKVFIKGIGGGRASSLKSLSVAGLELESIQDITPIPHNGCRPPKPRRV